MQTMKAMTSEHAAGRRKLARMGVKTTADIDRLKGCDSRYGWLKKTVGEDAADWILNDLASAQCARLK